MVIYLLMLQEEDCRLSQIALKFQIWYNAPYKEFYFVYSVEEENVTMIN